MNIDAVQPAAHPLAAIASPVPSERTNEQRELIQAVRAVNAAEVFGQNSELTFVLDRETRRPLVRLVDRETNEVIRQIPPEYVVRLAEDLKHAYER
jgi:flagellar protein FlaG